MLFVARALLLDEREWIEGGGLLVRAGRIVRVLRSPRAVARAATAGAGRRVDLGACVLAPGWVDAHAHLDLGALHGRVACRSGFVGWIGSLLRARRRLPPRAFEAGLRAGARELLASGTTTVGDIDSSGTCARFASELGLRVVLYREVLDAWDPLRTAPALALLRTRLSARRTVHEGISPHAPYTTSPALLAGVRVLAARRRLPLAIHWAESAEEEQWLERGGGPLAELLPPAPHRRGLELLARAGLLTPRTALIHGNRARVAELELLARARVSLVHCPGTHLFFARPRFPLERYRRAGVTLALGTDSLASNSALDMCRELALLRASLPRLAPAEAFVMATANGARALDLADTCGRLHAGLAADFVAWSLVARSRASALEELTAGKPRAQRVFVAGREKHALGLESNLP